MVRPYHYLFILIVVLTSCQSIYLDETTVVEKFENRLEKVVDEMISFHKDSSIWSNVDLTKDSNFDSQLSENPFCVYLIKDQQLIYWSDTRLGINQLRTIQERTDLIPIVQDSSLYVHIASSRGGITLITSKFLYEIESETGISSGVLDYKLGRFPDELSKINITLNSNIKYIRQSTLIIGMAIFIWMGFVALFFFLFPKITSQHTVPKKTIIWIGGLILMWTVQKLAIEPLFIHLEQWPTVIQSFVIIFLSVATIVFYNKNIGPLLSRNQYGTSGRHIYTIVTYFVVLLSLLGIARYYQYLILDIRIPLDFNHFFYSSSLTLFALGIVILGCIGVFILHHNLLSHLLDTNQNKKNRLLNFIVASIVFIPISLLVSAGFSFLFFATFAGIYILLYELFLEAKRHSITWMITWLILFSGYSAILLFKYNWQQDLEKRQEVGVQLLQNPDFSSATYVTAIYQDKQLVTTNSPEIYPNNYPFTSIPAKGSYEELVSDGRSELLLRSEDNRIVIIGKQLTGMIKPISSFSYVFVLFLLVIGIIVLTDMYLHYLPPELQFHFSNRSSLRNKIQLSVISVILASFVIIAIITVFYFKNTSEINYLTEQKTKINSIIHSIQSTLEEASDQNIAGSKNLENRMVDLASIHKTDLFYYNASGYLQQSFEVDYQSDHVPELVPFSDFRDLASTQSLFVFNNTPNEATSFAGIYSNDQKLVGVIGIPTGTRDQEISRTVNDFIGTLLNVYIFLLLLAGSVAIAVANSITGPLIALGASLKQFNLGKPNKMLHWENQDEVGELINNYNLMIQKLEDSAQFLAHTERELAWREMAKQVAHEIKNPLTPMKLSIQHMQHAIRTRPEEIENVVDRVSNTLVEQIDNLSQIASEFSTFAKMPRPENEKVILNEVAASAHDLFRKREDMDINLYVPIDEIYVFADKNHLIRVLNNIIKNAIQAIPSIRRGVINIKLTKEEDYAIIVISDNGIGIPEHMKDKVFYPNFTTKSSGTGLGLAISYNIIESFNGKLYFETRIDQGTDFYIELPLMHMKDNFSVQERVAL